MTSIDTKLVKRILGALFAIILVAGVVHAVSIDVFNKTEHVVTGADTSQGTYLRFDNRADSTSTWVKRDYNLRGTTVDLQAQTIDGVLVNNSDDIVSSWQAAITVENDCFINNAWVGTVEIHQYVGTDRETTQTLDLRNYKLEDVKLDYLYDGDLLIPLSKGDRVVYHPSKADEFNIAPRSELTMGVIFYYIDDLKLTNYSMNFYYYRNFTHGVTFVLLVVLAVIWVLFFAGSIVASISYRRAMRESNLRKSSLSSMSSLYSVISFIDLTKDELIPIYADDKTSEELPAGTDARKKLYDIFARDTAGPYRQAVLGFVDTDTLGERLEKGSIALEYISKSFGWSKIRFFAVDNEPGKPIEHALLTIQDINNEKREKEQFEQHAFQIQLDSRVRGSFVAGVSSGMRPTVQAIAELADKIAEKTSDETIRDYAEQIRERSELLTYLIDSAEDSSGINTEDIQTKASAYSFADMVLDARNIAKMVSVNQSFEIDVEISESIPAKLIGDKRRIQRALIGLIAQSNRLKRVDTAKIAAYGSVRDDVEHILLSIKLIGSGLSEEKEREFAEYMANLEQFGTQAIDDGIQEIEATALLLKHMGSELHVINEPEEGLELYFELEQKTIAGSSGS